MPARTLTLLLCVLLQPMAAQARGVESMFAGKVIVSTKRAPMRFKSQGAFAGWLRQNKKFHLWPEKTNKKQWKFEFMAFFARPLNDLEVKIKFFDVTEGKKFVAADSFYIPQRGQRIFASNMVVEQPRFEVNRKYMMQIIGPRGNTLLANTTFWLRGQKETYSGRVTFSDEDTKVKD